MRFAVPVTDYILAFICIAVINFALPRLMPGDPLQAIYGDEIIISMTPELQENLRRRFSLDRPVHKQFLTYFKNIFRGDLGYSYYHKKPVSDVILAALPWTMLIMAGSLFISGIAGTIAGFEAGYRRGSPTDISISTLFLSINGIPDFFTGIMLLLLFSITLGITPLSGAKTPFSANTGLALAADIMHHMILPVATLAVSRVSGVFLTARNSMVTVIQNTYVTVARAKGCSERRIRYSHAGRNALLPVVTASGLQMVHLFTGALFVEIVFSYPGLGSLLYNGLQTRDYPLIQGILLIVTALILVTNAVLEILYPLIDPRISHAR